MTTLLNFIVIVFKGYIVILILFYFYDIVFIGFIYCFFIKNVPGSVF